MSMVAKVASALERVLGDEVEELARKHGVIKRKRKFTGKSLLRMLVLTLLKNPAATFADWALTAAQLGVPVSDTAVEKRFTQPLVDFLRDALTLTLQQLISTKPLPIALLNRFTDVFLGDASSIRLPDELKDEFPGRGGKGDCCQAELKIQVRWNLKTGELPQVLIEQGKSSDLKSPIAHQEALPGSMEIFDLGYFSLERFRRLDDANAYFVSRFLHGTTVFNQAGQAVSLREFLPANEVQGVVDVQVQLGKRERLPCRLIAVRVPQELADRRRQKARENAQKHGRELSSEYSELLGWSLFITNAPGDLLSWKEVVVLYRTRWQIELLFKLWKSHNQLSHQRSGATREEVMAVLWAKLMSVILQHWLLLTAVPDERRSLFKAARALRDWIVSLIVALDNRQQLEIVLNNMKNHLTHVSKIETRKKHPSHFQLIEDPSLLDWAA
jgi:hypothetical protein